MNSRALGITAIVVLAAAALVAWWLKNYEPVQTEVAQSPQGEARYNPLYALKLTLQARGIEVSSRPHLSLNTVTLSPGDAMVLATDVRTVDAPQVTALLDWVNAGGHLVFALPRGADGRAGELMDALELSVTQHSRCLFWKLPKQQDKAQYCSGFRFQIAEDAEAEFDWLWGNAQDGYMMGRHARGAGSWFVAADLDFLENRGLDEEGNAALAWQVLAPMLGTGRVHLVYAANVPPLYVLIIERGWPIWVPLLLALLGWLWMRSQRLGPLLPMPATHRRALLDHVRASGEFAYGRGRGMALYAALRRWAMARVLRHEPVLAALDDAALIDALAVRHARPVAEIKHALQPVDLGRPDRFVSAIRTLMELGTKR